MKTDKKFATWFILLVIAFALSALDGIILSSALFGRILFAFIAGAMLGAYYILIIKDMSMFHLKLLLFLAVYLLNMLGYGNISLELHKIITALVPLVSFEIAKQIFVHTRKDWAIPLVLSLSLMVAMLTTIFLNTINQYLDIKYFALPIIIKYLVAMATIIVGYSVLSKRAQK